MNESLTIEKLRKTMEALPAAQPYWDGTIHENLVLVVTKSRPKSWHERLVSWPWQPWKKLLIWSEPDPNVYKMQVSDILGSCTREIWVAHPATAYRIRVAIHNEQKSSDA